jgi:hypothetical protein
MIEMGSWKANDRVALIDDLPEYGLRQGQVGTVAGWPVPGQLRVAFDTDAGEQLLVLVAARYVTHPAPPPARPGRGRRLLALLTLLAPVLLLTAARPLPSGLPPALALYAVESLGSEPGIEPWRLTALDPVTLADRAAGSGVAAWHSIWWPGVRSADGKTWVGFEFPPPGQVDPPETNRPVQVRAGGPHGPLLARHRPPGPAGGLFLSPDGRRLVLTPRPVTGPPDALVSERWWVMDVPNGALLAQAEAPPAAGWPLRLWIDPTGRLLYRLEAVGWDPRGTHPAGPAAAPHPLRLTAHDLMIGLEVGRLELPAVTAGTWRTGRTVAGRPIDGHHWPGIAQAPDGRLLALVHPDAPLVTLVDTERLAVVRTLSLTPPAVPPVTVAPLPPERADFPLYELSARQAHLAPDGRHLFLAGLDERIAPDGSVHSSGLGVWRVELATGGVIAGLTDRSIQQLVPLQAGGDLYVTGLSEWPNRDEVRPPSQRVVLWRLEPATLAVLAERMFAPDTAVDLVPAPFAGPPVPEEIGGPAAAAALDWLADTFLRSPPPVLPADGPSREAAPGLARPVSAAFLTGLTVTGERATAGAVVQGADREVMLRLTLAYRSSAWQVEAALDR